MDDTLPSTSSSSSSACSQSSSLSGGIATARPLSASNASASIANARFKTFQVQYDILRTNTLASALASEIPWKNLFELFTLKFCAVSDVLWRQGEPAHEMAFVLCGGFAARHVDLVGPVSSAASAAGGIASSGYGVSASAHHYRQQQQPSLDSTCTERMVKPGESLAALAVHCGAPMAYAVVAAKFKSIVLALPSGKYKSILRQISPELSARVEQLVYEAENNLLSGLGLRSIAPPKGSSNKQHGTSVGSPTKRQKYRASALSSSVSTLHRSVSTPALGAASNYNSHPHSSSSGPNNATALQLDTTASWASLQVAKPVEYEVNSSLLILHDATLSRSAASLHHLVPAAAAAVSSKKVLSRTLQASAAARSAAKKHTQRRLQSIKLPSAIDAFTPAPKLHAGDTGSDESLLMLAEVLGGASGRQQPRHVDVVLKTRVGRLLQPLRRPATVGLDDLIGSSQRSNSVSLAQSFHQRVLVADRAEPFRAEW